jgi:hypothetical protein
MATAEAQRGSIASGTLWMIGLAILLVVVLGNPSAGGAYAGPLLPEFWREIGPALIPGAGTWLTRSLAYFDGHAVGGPLLVLGGWAVAGTLLTLLTAMARRDYRDPLEPLEPVTGYRSLV